MPRIRTHTNPLNYTDRLTPVSISDLFPGHEGPIDVEIGVGLGEFIRAYGEMFPERRVLGVEVRKQAAELAKTRMKATGITNVHLIHSTGERVLEDALPDRCISKMFIFHPDPWFKTKHHKRRLISNAFLDLAARKLVPNALLYVSTDAAPLWESIEAAFLAHPGFEKASDDDFWRDVYHTHWQAFTEKEARSQHKGVYRRLS